MSFTTAFIQQPTSWDALAESVKNLTRDAAREVRYIGSIEELTTDDAVVHIVVMGLTGAAKYAIEIYWAGMCELADDAVGMHIACSVDSDVIVAANKPSPHAWMLLSPNGMIQNIDLDIEQLDDHNRVAYKVE